MSVTIRRQDRPFGVLGAYTTRRRTFNRDDVHFLQTVANMLAEAIERKRIEEALRESEERFRDIAENAVEWIWEVDTNGRYTYSSPVVEEVLGYKAEEVLGKHFYDLFHPEDREELKKAAFEAFAQKEVFRGFINRNIHKNGKIVWLSTSGVSRLDAQGNLLGYRGADTDITERKRAEEALSASEERYRSLFEQSPVSLWEEDFSAVKAYIDNLRRSGIKDFRRYFEDHREAVYECAAMVKVVDVSEGTLDLYGIDDKERLREGLAIVFGEESYDVFREELIAIAEGKTWFESEAITKTLAGDKIHISLKLTVPPGYEETLSKVLVSIIDITERKQAEEALWESGERFRHMTEAASWGTVALEGAEPQGTVASVVRISRHGVPLTPRQKEVLGHIVDGRTNEEIAETLVVSRRTVERHVAAIFDKLGARNRAGAAALAVAAGLARPKARLP